MAARELQVEKLRIAHVFRAPLGGLFRHVVDLASEQAARGHEVGVFFDSGGVCERVAAALTGTLLGIFIAYGFVNPIANRIALNNNADSQCLRCIKIAVAGFAKGLAPLTAVEIARRSLDTAVQPSARDLEAATKTMAPAK